MESASIEVKEIYQGTSRTLYLFERTVSKIIKDGIEIDLGNNVTLQMAMEQHNLSVGDVIIFKLEPKNALPQQPPV